MVRRGREPGNGEDLMKIQQQTTRTSWEPLPRGRLPRPTYFPAGLAMGTTFIFWGLISSWVVILVGLSLFAAALAGWLTEIRHERRQR
jgi:hypothetical protein